MKFICEKCGNSFTAKQSLKRHQNKKVACVKEIPEEVNGKTCKWCGKTFAHRNGKYKHVKNCSVKKNQVAIKRIQREKEDQEMRQRQIKLEQRMDEMEQQNIRLIEENEQLRGGQNKQIINNDNRIGQVINGNVVNAEVINININNINYVGVDGKPIIRNHCLSNTSYITPKGTVQMTNKDLDNAIIEMIQQIFFNPGHPENHSVHMEDDTYQTMVVWKNGAWVSRGTDIVLGDIRDYGQGYLEEKLYRGLENRFDGTIVKLQKAFNDPKKKVSDCDALRKIAIGFRESGVTPDTINARIKEELRANGKEEQD